MDDFSLPYTRINQPARDEPARTFFEQLRGHIQGIEANLKDGQSLELLSSAAGESFRVSSIGYEGSDMFIFYGRDSEGDEFAVFAHLHTVQFVVKVVTSSTPEPYHPIGFRIRSQ